MLLEDCRPEVQALALLIESRLRENDHKSPWQRGDPDAYWRRAADNLSRLRSALHHGPRDKIREHAADAINYVLFAVGCAGALDLPRCVDCGSDMLTPQDIPIERSDGARGVLGMLNCGACGGLHAPDPTSGRYVKATRGPDGRIELKTGPAPAPSTQEGA